MIKEVFVSDADQAFFAVRQAPSHGKREATVYGENASLVWGRRFPLDHEPGRGGLAGGAGSSVIIARSAFVKTGRRVHQN